MDAARRQMIRELDEDILAYVREAAQFAPVTDESIRAFEVNIRRRRTDIHEIRDRLQYLVSAEYLRMERVWDGGEVIRYTITADGIEVLDRVRPWRDRGPA